MFDQVVPKLLEGEFICEAVRDGVGRDELTVRVEARCASDDATVQAAFAALLRAKLGVDCAVVLEAPGALAPLTGIETRQKPVRLIDRRFA